MKHTTKIARPTVTSLGNTIPPSRHKEVDGTIYLRNNENPFGGDFRRYPGFTQDGLDDLVLQYLNLIKRFEHNCGSPPVDLDERNVLLTQGAASGLEQVFKAFFEPGIDSVVLTPPCFSIFPRIAAIYNISTDSVPLSGDEHNRLNVDAICQSGAKGIVICDPNNPIGSRLHPDDITRLLDNFKGLVVIDEAYVEYSRYPSNLVRLNSHPNLLIIRTMSKALGMAGLRIGTAIGSKDLILALSKVQLPFSVSSVAAREALTRLTNEEEIKSGIMRFRKERDRVFDALISLPFITGIWGSDGGFITIQVSDLDAVRNKLSNALIEPVYKPEGLSGYIRISIGTEVQNTHLIDSLRSLS